MGVSGWYYLHESGELIYKPSSYCLADFDSDFVKCFWPLDICDRGNAWQILIESLAGGADHRRIIILANRWGCNNGDAHTYADRVGVTLDHALGGVITARSKKTTLAGEGRTCLEAMADLCKKLGYRPQKIWPKHFEDFLK